MGSDVYYLRVELLLLFVESLLFGAFCILYLMSLWVLVYRRRRSERSPASLWMAVVVTAMYALAGTYLSFDVGHVTAAFADHSMTPGGPMAYLSRPGSNPSRNVDPVLFILMTYLWDAFMTYRIFEVWNRKPISLVLPALLFVGNLVTTGFLGNGLLRDGHRMNSNSLLDPVLYSRLIAYFTMTLFTNLVMTLQLLGRLWWYDKRARRYRPRHTSDSVHWRVMRTIIYSEIAYSSGVVLNLAAYAAQSELVLITSAMLPPIVGISFALIIMRIGLSEVLADVTDKGMGMGETPAAALGDSARALSHIAVNVHISRMDDSEDVSMCEDKTVSACHDVVEDAPGCERERGAVA